MRADRHEPAPPPPPGTPEGPRQEERTRPTAATEAPAPRLLPVGRAGRRPAWAGADRWLYPTLLVAIMLVAWEAGVHLFEVPHYILPGPLEVAQALAERPGLFARHTAVTLGEVVAGGLLGIVVGLGLGLALFFSAPLEKAVYPLLVTSQNVPVFAIAPLLVVWLGYGFASKVVMAAIIVFFPITIAMLDGLKRTDPDLVRLFRIMGASPGQILWKLRLPAALPTVFSGLKLSAIYSTIGAVIGEWVGAGAGLGYLMLSANAQLRIADVFGAIVCLTPIGLLLLGTVTLAERLALPWQHTSRDEAEVPPGPA